ncbi:MAG: VIT1/CCC1 transporter family protein [Patescibacteria group bacterium]
MGVRFEREIAKHLREDHRITPFSTYMRQIVYGGSDGIVTTFAVVAGFTGAQSGNTAMYSIVTVLLFGMANLFADGTSMAVGEFLSSRSEGDIYHRQRKQEAESVNGDPQNEREQTKGLLKREGFTSEQAEQITELYAQNKSFWIDFMMKYELSLEEPDEKPIINAVVTFFSFVMFGFIPLIPYLFDAAVMASFYRSIAFTIGAMTLLGLLRWIVTKQQIFRSVGETVLLGVISASIAFFVGTLFR